jgi:hypothetical protein
MSDVLPNLLSRIRDGIATDADRLRARAFVEADGTLPPDVREVALTVPEEAPEDAAALLALLGLEPLLPDLDDAMEVDLSAGVMEALGLDVPVPVAEAVAFEAGTVDVAGRVMAELGLAARPTPVAVPAPLPLVANNARAFRWAAVALAAAALFALIVGRGEVVAPEHFELAQAGDVVVEDLTYSEGVQVVQLEGTDGAVILWVDDGDV